MKGTGTTRSPGWAALALTAAVLLGACGAEGDAAPPPAPLSGGAASVEELGSRLVAALAEGDTAALRRLRLSEREHNELVWPEMPAARQDPPFPVELAWENLQIRNAGALAELLPRLAGTSLKAVGVECRAAPQRYASFTVLGDCVVTVDSGDGPPWKIQPFRSVVVAGGVHKVVRYRVD